MNPSTLWNRSQKKFDQTSFVNKIKSFKQSDLADPVQNRKWFQFAKQFSQIDISPQEVEQMGFQNFNALKHIMAATLAYLSQETINQNERISELQKQERTLRTDLNNLKRIESQNLAKERKIRQQLQRLQEKEKQKQLQFNGQSSIESHNH